MKEYIAGNIKKAVLKMKYTFVSKMKQNWGELYMKYQQEEICFENETNAVMKNNNGFIKKPLKLWKIATFACKMQLA